MPRTRPTQTSARPPFKEARADRARNPIVLHRTVTSMVAWAAMLGSQSIDCSRKAFKVVTRPRGGTFYPDEIEIQGAHYNHRKLDSQATLSHRTRGRAPDELRPQTQPARPSRRDHDPDRLSSRSAGLGGVRPAMAADRAVPRAETISLMRVSNLTVPIMPTLRPKLRKVARRSFSMAMAFD